MKKKVFWMIKILLLFFRNVGVKLIQDVPIKITAFICGKLWRTKMNCWTENIKKELYVAG